MARAHLRHHYFCFIGTGSCGAGTGISSRVLSNSRCQELSATIDADVQYLQQGVNDLTDSLSSLAEVALQNRRGLDLLFLQQGGLCAALKEECCFYVDKTGLVKESMKKVGGGGRWGREGGQSWHQNWFSTSPWLTTLLPSSLGPLVVPLLLISFGPWAFSRLTSLIKQQVDDWAVKPIHVHYHRLALEDLGKEGSASTPISTQSRSGQYGSWDCLMLALLAKIASITFQPWH